MKNATWKIVLRPNPDCPSDERPTAPMICPRDFPTREAAVAVEQGIAASGKWWGKVVTASDAAATLHAFGG